MTPDDCDMVASLQALRAQAGVVRQHAERQRRISIAARMATIQGEVAAEIEKLSAAQSQPEFPPVLDLPESKPTRREVVNQSSHFPDP